ncbi:MAG: DUF4290 domain-containing protein [Bacteroidales bacterium]
MEYNSTQKKLLLPEYGRNVQKMAEHLLTIQDREQRTRATNELIGIMGNMFPHLRDVKDFKHKLWDHLALMTKYELDVDFPYPITRIENVQKPERLPYNSYNISHRHYGTTIKNIIKKAAEMEDSEDKKALIRLIANHMKKQNNTWNKNNVDDEVIFNDLREISNGKITIDPGVLKLNGNNNNSNSSYQNQNIHNNGNHNPHNTFKKRNSNKKR